MEKGFNLSYPALILVGSLFVLQVLSDPSPVVTTKSGQLQGQLVQFNPSESDEPVELYQFTAIPFAAPPVGPLRFKKTQPLKQPGWQGVLNATNWPNACSQSPPPRPGNNDTGAEDCLYLNVWVPKATLDAFADNGTDKTALSVFVFIHGGAFAFGSTKDSTFDGRYLAGFNNIIAVTIQYRLGSLGFAYLGNDEVPGNMGLWDQLEALKWISENIGSFGGNNQQITIGGESAGAVSTSWHLLSPNSRKYFQKAIIQSGTAISPWGRNSAQVALAVTNMVFQQICNQQSLSEKMQCLRSADSRKFPSADQLPNTKIYEHILHPVTAGDFLPRDPVVMMQSGDFYKVPLIIGANQDEGSMFVAMTEVASKILPSTTPSNNRSLDDLTFDNYNTLMSDRCKQIGAETYYPTLPNQFLIDAVKYQYWPQIHEGQPKGAEVFKAVSDAHGEMGMLCPSYVWAKLTAQNGVAKVFAYHLTQRVKNSRVPEFMGVMHGDDLQFMFGVPFAPEPPSDTTPTYTDDEKQLSRNIMTYWGNFIKYGDPNGEPAEDSKLPKWPAYVGTSCSQQYFNLNTETIVTDPNSQNAVFCGLKERNCMFWQDYMPKLVDRLVNSTSPQPQPNTTANSHRQSVFLVIFIAMVAMVNACV